VKRTLHYFEFSHITQILLTALHYGGEISTCKCSF